MSVAHTECGWEALDYDMKHEATGDSEDECEDCDTTPVQLGLVIKNEPSDVIVVKPEAEEFCGHDVSSGCYSSD